MSDPFSASLSSSALSSDKLSSPFESTDYVLKENITTGLKIENMCNKIIQMFESRLNVIEQKIDTKCDESKVRDIVKDELAKAQDQITSYADVTASESVKRVDKVEMTTVVVNEINERKKRENNIVIFGLQESESDEKKERGEHDLRLEAEISVTKV
jgi:hypothetical protein